MLFYHQAQHRREEQFHHWLWKVSLPLMTESTNQKMQYFDLIVHSQHRPPSLP